MLAKIKTKFYNWLLYRQHKKNVGLSFFDFNKLKKEKANYINKETVKFKNRDLQINSPFWFLHSVKEIFIDEVYKFTPASKDLVIIDCGANIGLSIIYFKEKFPHARVLAFEPDPIIFGTLQKNVKEFSLSDIELINKAIWIENTILEFNAEGTVGGRLGLGEVEVVNKVDVKTVRLRDFLDQKIDFLKIDIEGAEYAVLKDCIDKLHNVDKLFIEYHVMPNEQQYLDEMLLWIRKAGFRYYIKEAWENKRNPFMEEKLSYYEMQLNISCYR